MEAPAAQRRRRCTDVPCLLLFAAAVAALFYILSVAKAEGDVARLVRGSDVSFDVCGQDNSEASTGLPLRTTLTRYPPGHSLPLRSRLPEWMGGGDQARLAVTVDVLRGGRNLTDRPLLYWLLPPGVSTAAPEGIGVCVAACPAAVDQDGWPCADFAERRGNESSSGAHPQAGGFPNGSRLDSCALDAASAEASGRPACAAPTDRALAACAATNERCGVGGDGARVCVPAYASLPLLGAYCLPASATAPATVLASARAYDRALDSVPQAAAGAQPASGAQAEVDRRALHRLAALAPPRAAHGGDGDSGWLDLGLWMLLWSDVRLAASLLGWCAVLSLLLAGLWLLAMRHHIALVVWLPPGLLLSCLCAAAAYLHLALPPPYSAAAFGALGLAALLLVAVALLRAHISRAVWTLRSASGAIVAVPSLCAEPLLTLAAVVAVLCWAAAGLLLLLGAAERRLGRGAPQLRLSSRLQWLIALHCGLCLWLLLALEHIGRAAVAGAVADWYFGGPPRHGPAADSSGDEGSGERWHGLVYTAHAYQPAAASATPADEEQAAAAAGRAGGADGADGSSWGRPPHGCAGGGAAAPAHSLRSGAAARPSAKRGGAALPPAVAARVLAAGDRWARLRAALPARLPVASAYWRLLRYHLGTVALGSLLVAGAALFRLTVYFAYRQLRSAAKVHRSCASLVECACCCVTCCLACAERSLSLLSSRAYVHVQHEGCAFFQAAQAAAAVSAARDPTPASGRAGCCCSPLHCPNPRRRSRACAAVCPPAVAAAAVCRHWLAGGGAARCAAACARRRRALREPAWHAHDRCKRACCLLRRAQRTSQHPRMAPCAQLRPARLRFALRSATPHRTLTRSRRAPARRVQGGTSLLCLWILKTREPFVSGLTLGVAGPLLAVCLQSCVLAGSVLGLYGKTAHALFHCAAMEQAAAGGARAENAHARLEAGRGEAPSGAELRRLLKQPTELGREASDGGRRGGTAGLAAGAAVLAEPSLRSTVSTAGSEMGLMADDARQEEEAARARRGEPPPYSACDCAQPPPPAAAVRPIGATAQPGPAWYHGNPWGEPAAAPVPSAPPLPSGNPWGEPSLPPPMSTSRRTS